MQQSIYEFVTTEENNFQTEKVSVGDNWEWSFRDHVQLIFHLRNGMFRNGDNDVSTSMRAFKNIMEPILELCSWTEDIELKDIVFYVENDSHRVMSFLIKKFYDEVYTKKYNLDSFIDELTDSDLDYGGAIVQKTGGPRPELKKLNQVAFCDQTDALGSPIGFKMYFSPSKLRLMGSLGWGNEENGANISLEDLCVLAEGEKDTAGDPNAKKNKVPGKQIEVYVVMGDMPSDYLHDDGDFQNHIRQLQVIAYYYDKKGKRNGVTLYRKEDIEDRLKFFTSNEVYGRALGRGVGERLIHSQVWTNFLTVHKTKLLEAAAKIIPYTDDEEFDNRNKLDDVENLEVKKVAKGSTFGLIPTAGVANVQLYEKSINEWYDHAQLQGAAFDPILGEEQPSGTTFRGQERSVAQGKGPHNKRRGKRAKFIEEVWRWTVIPYIKREILRGKKFLATLTADEMRWISERLADKYVNTKFVDSMIGGKIPTKEAEQMFRDEFMQKFSKMGNTQLIEILENEFEDAEINIGINVSGKQKDLANLTDKVLSVFQFIFTNRQAFTQAMQIPALAKAFDDLLEFSGINPADFSTLMQATNTTIQNPTQGAQGGQVPAANLALNKAAPVGV